MKSINKINQAVILAGGLGTRLKPFTDTNPKPMYPFYGKPFLEYIILMLKEQGFNDFLLLLGYLPEKIIEYFGDGSKFGIKIEYSVSDIENETGKRIKIASDLIKDTFFLVYCDNLFPVQIDKMQESFFSSEALVQITAYSNEDSYTKNNLIIDENNYIKIYDKSRKTQGLKGVDIGFAIIKKEVIDLLPNENISFEGFLYPNLSKNNKLKAFITEHRYYSVGSYERLKLTEEFLSDKKTIILDRDGVLNKKAPKAQYITSWNDWVWLDGAKEALKLLTENEFRIIIVSNQAGINRGFMTVSDLETIHDKMIKDVINEGGYINKIYYCPHDWNENCACRKPKAGMLFQAQKDFHIDLTKTYFIGDDERDIMAANIAGCLSALVDESNSLLKIVKNLILR
ncbi:MAG: HAD-IIIA family hydrolase [Candidatus Sericytochromatia bacterium]